MEHGGSWQGYASHIVRYPEDSITVAVLTNLTGTGNAAGLMANRIARHYIPGQKPDLYVQDGGEQRAVRLR